MADNSDTPTPPAPTKAAPRKAMAPTARRPEGDDATMQNNMAVSLEPLDDRELDALEGALRAERARRVRHPRPPSFGMSEGERQELEQRGTATSPWTGEKITGDGAPRT